MNFGERLTELRISNGYSKRNEFADKLGIPSTTLRNYETGVREPGHTFLKQISEMFNVSVDYLLGLTDEKEVLNSFRLRASEYDHIKQYRLLDDAGRSHVNAVLSWETERLSQLTAASDIVPAPTRIISYYQRLASAGTGEYLFDSVPTDTIEVPLNNLSEEADFVIGVNGDSMEPTYYDGDMVYVKIANEIPTGHIGVFTRGNECFIKELGFDCLLSHNRKRNNIAASDDIRLVGEVLGKVEM
ncbi:XRE family transcriptional regulator [Clostridium sp. AN503]|uniref:XRE family transcriptional regulator n=1 Tax=Clostridium sp. AN503 TaxID=3160598 RepID=UPI00345AA4EF